MERRVYHRITYAALARTARCRDFSVFLLFGGGCHAFLLLFLVSLSVPIIKTIFLFRLSAGVSSHFLHSSASGSVTFGVWGYCVSSLDVSVAGFNEGTTASCSKPRLGYSFDSTVADALHVSGLENLIARTVTLVLALHPVACILTFITFVISLYTLRREKNGTSLRLVTIGLIFGILTGVVSTIVLIVDLVFVSVVRRKLKNDIGNDITLTWGNAVWITLAAKICLWIVNFVVVADVINVRRKKNRKTEDTT